ncbi:MAG: hypothetical protein LC808_00170, partial [Actinobacteria bacterium]|nr:hypothetical protein [Actinomycetota bacterium]
ATPPQRPVVASKPFPAVFTHPKSLEASLVGRPLPIGGFGLTPGPYITVVGLLTEPRQRHPLRVNLFIGGLLTGRRPASIVSRGLGDREEVPDPPGLRASCRSECPLVR